VQTLVFIIECSVLNIIGKVVVNISDMLARNKYLLKKNMPLYRIWSMFALLTTKKKDVSNYIECDENYHYSSLAKKYNTNLLFLFFLFF
jgi:hypothetical protein